MSLATQPLRQGIVSSNASGTTARQKRLQDRREDRRDEKQDRREDRRDRRN